MEAVKSLVINHVWLFLCGCSIASFVVGLIAGRLLSRGGTEGEQADEAEKGGERGQGRKRSSAFELYVGNLPYEMDDAGLKKMLDPFGEVVSARIITNRLSNSSKGYGFAKMAAAEQVKAAISGLNNRELEGRRIIVSEARTRPRSRRG